MFIDKKKVQTTQDGYELNLREKKQLQEAFESMNMHDVFKDAIANDFNVPPETMKKIVDWLKNDFPMGAFYYAQDKKFKNLNPQIKDVLKAKFPNLNVETGAHTEPSSKPQEIMKPKASVEPRGPKKTGDDPSDGKPDEGDPRDWLTDEQKSYVANKAASAAMGRNVNTSFDSHSQSWQQSYAMQKLFDTLVAQMKNR